MFRFCTIFAPMLRIEDSKSVEKDLIPMYYMSE